MATAEEVNKVGQAMASQIFEKFPIIHQMVSDPVVVAGLLTAGLLMGALMLLALFSRRGGETGHYGGPFDRKIAKLEVKLQDLTGALTSFIGHTRDDLGFIKAELMELRTLSYSDSDSQVREETAAQVSSNLLNYIQSTREENGTLVREISQVKALIEAMRTDRRQILERLVEDNTEETAAPEPAPVPAPIATDNQSNISKLIPNKINRVQPRESAASQGSDLLQEQEPAPRRVVQRRSAHQSFFMD